MKISQSLVCFIRCIGGIPLVITSASGPCMCRKIVVDDMLRSGVVLLTGMI